MPYSSSHGTNLLWRPCHPLNRHHQPSGDAVLEGAGVARTSIPGGGEALQGTGGTGWSSRKRRPKAWEGATPRCHGRQVRAAGTSVVRKGRWRKISSRRSSPRESEQETGTQRRILTTVSAECPAAAQPCRGQGTGDTRKKRRLGLKARKNRNKWIWSSWS
ncbi:hypothetical protein PVAP13_9NG430914 [Panicum virgatum]|uniref:Uncharacterized protein n=1 Tax=Panicum virgatum TaxID=38727 RepID=A0A8T0MNX8_PANVG|nr:hypothetical protein PVAP13_9NG430914 [Panicum virgatum]